MIDIIPPKKSLGQNFLIDNNISRKIIEQLDIKENDLVIEIGPGTGALTSLLLEKNISLTIVEIDKRAVSLLKTKFLDKSINIIESDIRKVDLREIAKEKKLKVIGNIPYYISADIMFMLLENYKIIDTIVLMVQKEVAKRVISGPDSKDYGILSIATDLVMKAKIAFDVSPNCFFPKPKVTSSILKLKEKENLIGAINFNDIMKLVKSAFSQRRKTLRNSLKSYLMQYDDEILNSFSNEYSLILNQRAENLTPQDYVQMYQCLNKIK